MLFCIRDHSQNPTWAPTRSGTWPLEHYGCPLQATGWPLLCSVHPLQLPWCEGDGTLMDSHGAHHHWSTQPILGHGVLLCTAPSSAEGWKPLDWCLCHLSFLLCLSFCLHLFFVSFSPSCFALVLFLAACPSYSFFHLSFLFF